MRPKSLTMSFQGTPSYTPTTHPRIFAPKPLAAVTISQDRRASADRRVSPRPARHCEPDRERASAEGTTRGDTRQPRQQRLARGIGPGGRAERPDQRRGTGARRSPSASPKHGDPSHRTQRRPDAHGRQPHQTIQLPRPDNPPLRPRPRRRPRPDPRRTRRLSGQVRVKVPSL